MYQYQKIPARVQKALRRQATINTPILSLIIEEHGFDDRRSMAYWCTREGLPYSSKSMSAEEARKIYVPSFVEKPKEVQGTASRSGQARGVITNTNIVLVIIIGLIALIAWGVFHRSKPATSSATVQPAPATEQSVPQSSEQYQYCEQKIKPKLERCLEGPESGWPACRVAYLSELGRCTGHYPE